MSVASSIDPVVQPGDRIGRYSVVDTLGHGGMGVVVLAHDPELDRDVAIKLLHPKVRRKLADAQRRLLREAQAMAALSHPNVIGVHDVGTWREHVFVAMEYVHGITLRTWAEQHPPVEEILRVYIAAGRGLAAAHRADLVHRDFKPDNVMIAEDGRVLVLDFGLARVTHTQSSDSSPSIPSGQEVSGRDLDSLTDPGAAMGTPMYMAPEQHAGMATPASDQYSFCVALYEALTGERPFVGRDVFALAAQKVQFEIRPFPDRPRLPRALKAAIRRGLHPDPEQRFRSIDDLLEMLERRRGIDPLAAGVLLAAGVAATIGIVALRTAVGEPCETAGGPVVWDDDKRESVRAALLATGVPYAVETTSTVLAELDARAEELAASRQQACTATHVDATQSEAVLDLRIACLDRSAHQLAALVTVLEQADRDVVEHAVAAVRGSKPAACDDVVRLQQEVPSPEDPAARVAVEQLQTALAGVQARIEAGKYREALDDLEGLSTSADALDHPPVRGWIERYRADALQNLSELEPAMEAWLAAAHAATEAGDDRTAAIAYLGAAWTLGHSLGKPGEGRGHLRSAEALVERLGSPPDLQRQVLLTSGVLSHDEGAFDDALRDVEAARALEEAEGTASAAVLTDLARVLLALGRTDEAETALQRAIAIAERDQGEAHPQVAKVLAHVGMLMMETGRMEAALAAHQRSLDIYTAALPEDHMLVAFGLSGVAGIEMYLQRFDSARPKLERARDILRKRLGPDHPDVGRITGNIGESWRMSGDLDRSLAEYQASLATLVAGLGADHPHVARGHNNVASVLYSMDRHDEAEREYRLALDSLVVTLGEDHPGIAYPLTGIGQTLIERGRAAEAMEPLERALALRAGDAIDPFDLGDTKLALARALWDEGSDRTRAAELARGARQAYIDAGPERHEAREWVEHWLKERGLPFAPEG